MLLVSRGLTGKSHIAIKSPMRGRGRGAAGMRGAGRGGYMAAAAAARGYRRNISAADVSASVV